MGKLGEGGSEEGGGFGIWGLERRGGGIPMDGGYRAECRYPLGVYPDNSPLRK